MSEPLYGVYGASGHGREVMPLVRAEFVRKGIPVSRLVFVDDGSPAHLVNGHRVMNFDEFAAEPASSRSVTLAIANGLTRSRLATRCAAEGMAFFGVRSVNTIVLDDVEIGEGAILSPYVSLTSNIRIGRHFHANMYSYVAHDCRIGDFVTFAPAVKCNGNVIIEDHAYVGSGSVIRQGVPGVPLVIGEGAVIGMGAVVTRSVAAGLTVAGNPARPLLKR